MLKNPAPGRFWKFPRSPHQSHRTLTPLDLKRVPLTARAEPPPGTSHTFGSPACCPAGGPAPPAPRSRPGPTSRPVPGEPRPSPRRQEPGGARPAPLSLRGPPAVRWQRAAAAPAALPAAKMAAARFAAAEGERRRCQRGAAGGPVRSLPRLLCVAPVFTISLAPGGGAQVAGVEASSVPPRPGARPVSPQRCPEQRWPPAPSPPSTSPAGGSAASARRPGQRSPPPHGPGHRLPAPPRRGQRPGGSGRGSLAAARTGRGSPRAGGAAGMRRGRRRRGAALLPLSRRGAGASPRGWRAVAGRCGRSLPRRGCGAGGDSCRRWVLREGELRRAARALGGRTAGGSAQGRGLQSLPWKK